MNEAIVKLLGLGYDEFIQTVVLPQGEFARFLRAKPTGQRAILQHLLRHDVFARMRDLAEERRRDMDARDAGPRRTTGVVRCRGAEKPLRRARRVGRCP